jgi:hypothetical protein
MKDAKQASSARKDMHGPVGRQAVKGRLFSKMPQHCPRDKVKVKVQSRKEKLNLSIYSRISKINEPS